MYEDLRYLNLEDAEKALSNAQKDTEKDTESEAEAEAEAEAGSELAVAETNALIGALIALNRFEQTKPYFEQLINDKEEQNDCALWQNYEMFRQS